jgi:hypothetical protein
LRGGNQRIDPGGGNFLDEDVVDGGVSMDYDIADATILE